MSVSFHFDDQRRLVTLRLSGRISGEQFLSYTSLLNGLTPIHGPVRFLLVMRDLRGMRPAEFFEDLKFDFGRQHGVERVAIATEGPWKKMLARFFRSLDGDSLRVFDTDHEDDAWDWIHESAEASPAPIQRRKAG